jgi:hypothetical protein
MTINPSNATVFINIEVIEGSDQLMRLNAYHYPTQTMLSIKTWQIDLGDDERYDLCQLEAEAYAAYWCDLLSPVEQFTFAGLLTSGWPASARVHAEPFPLALIATEYATL